MLNQDVINSYNKKKTFIFPTSGIACYNQNQIITEYQKINVHVNKS